MKGTVGYILRRFPVLSEAFVLEEILALEAQGTPVRIYALSRSRDSRYHANLAKLKSGITYVPELGETDRLLEANKAAARAYGRRYFDTLRYTLSKANPTLLWRFIQAGFLAANFRRRNIQHLHAHFATRATSAALLASKMTGQSYSFTAHAYDIYSDRAKRDVLEEKIQRARSVVTISDFNQQFLEELSPSASGKISRIYTGVDFDRFVPPESLPAAEPFTIVTVARLVEKKGLMTLVAAARILHERGVDFRLRVIGQGQLRQRLERAIDEGGLRGRVRLLGALRQDDVLAQFQAAHLYVLPCVVAANGNRDGLPVSIIEALACGLPVISSPVTAIPEAIRHGHNGLLLPEHDARGLADAIESMITNEELYRTLAANARSSVLTRFDIREQAANLARIFEGV